MSLEARASRWIGVWFVVTALWWSAGSARAADPRAESLFQEALELMKDGNFAAACPKLRASHEIEPKSGALIMLANCHEQVGKTASAWAEYMEAASLARGEGRPKNAEKASGLAETIEAKLSKLRIDVTSGTAGLTVKLDDEVVPSGTFGAAVPVDPGAHMVSAAAPGHVDWSIEVILGGDADRQTVTVPVLVVQEPPAAPPSVVPPPQPATSAAPAPAPGPEAGGDGDGVPAWAWIAGGVGVGLAAVAVTFRVDQSSAASELDDRCGEERLSCPADYDFESDRAREQLDYGLFVGSTIGGVIGIGVAVVGMVTASSDTTTSTEALQVVPWVGRETVGSSIRLSF